MTETDGDSGKSDLDDSVIAQLLECGLHARYSQDVEGGWWARDQIRDELLRRGWTLPPYAREHDLADTIQQTETVLPADASALVATTEGGLEFVMANVPDDADVPPSVQLLVAVMLRSEDPEWVGKMMSWLEAQGDAE